MIIKSSPYNNLIKEKHNNIHITKSGSRIQSSKENRDIKPLSKFILIILIKPFLVSVSSLILILPCRQQTGNIHRQ